MTVERTEVITEYSGQKTPREVCDRDHFSAVVAWKIPWVDRGAFLDEVGANGGEVYPHAGYDAIRAIRTHTEGFGKPVAYDGDTRLFKWDYAIVYVEYSTRAPRWLGRSVDEELKISAAMYQLNPAALAWDVAGAAPFLAGETPPHRIEYGLDYVIRYNEVWGIPAAATSYINCVNSTVAGTWTLGLTFPVGTLLYAGPGEESRTGLGMLPKLKLTYLFKYRGIDWNYHWRQSTNAFAPFYDLATGIQIVNHPYVNFAALVP